MSRAGRICGVLRSKVRRVIAFDSPPSLQETIFRVVFVAVAVPVVVAALGNHLLPYGEDNRSPDRQLLDSSIRQGLLVMSDSDYEQMKDIVEMDSRMRNNYRAAWPPDAVDFEWSWMPSPVYDQLMTKGYAFGDTFYPNSVEEARFAVWRVAAGTPTGIERESYMSLVMVPRSTRGEIIEWLIVLGFNCLLVAAIASPAAGYLALRIVRPVRQVAEASRVLAEGGRPMPVPVKGPAELRTLSESFNGMAAKLEGAQAAEQEFLMSVSHELKTPLTAIDGYAELLAEGAVTGEQAGPVLTAEAGRLRRLVFDLLDLAKMRQSAFTVRDERVDLDAVAAEVVRRHSARAEQLGVRLVALPSGGPSVRGDEDRLVQAVSNLVENALGCVPAGGLVSIETRPGELAVRDDGPGLAADDLAHTFERFYLHDRLKTERDMGTGLGLAIVKELVERMGGEVSAAGEPGKGAVFSLRLTRI